MNQLAVNRPERDELAASGMAIKIMPAECCQLYHPKFTKVISKWWEPAFAVALLGEDGREIDGGCGLAAAALLINDGNRSQRRVLSSVKGGQKIYRRRIEGDLG